MFISSIGLSQTAELQSGGEGGAMPRPPINASKTNDAASAPPRSVPKSVDGTIFFHDGSNLSGEILWQPSLKTYKLTRRFASGGIRTEPIALNKVRSITTQPPARLKKAQSDYDSRKYNAVITALTPLLDEHIMLQYDMEIADCLARAHLAQDNPSAAVKVCERVAAGKPQAACNPPIFFIYWDALRAQGNADEADKLLDKSIKSGAVLPAKYWDYLKARNKIDMLKALMENAITSKPPQSIPVTYWEPFKALGDTEQIFLLIGSHVGSCEKIPLDYFNLFIIHERTAQLDLLIEKIINTNGRIPDQYWNDSLTQQGLVMASGKTTLASRFVLKSLEFSKTIPQRHQNLARQLQSEVIAQRREKFNKDIKEVKEKYNEKCKPYVEQLSKEIAAIKKLYFDANLPAGVEAVKYIERDIESIYGDSSTSPRYYRGMDSYNRKLSIYYAEVNTDELKTAINKYNNSVSSFTAAESKERMEIMNSFLAFLSAKYQEVDAVNPNEGTMISYDISRIKSILQELGRTQR
jgi:Putative Zn-dependent protease, contains TPR repeats